MSTGGINPDLTVICYLLSDSQSIVEDSAQPLDDDKPNKVATAILATSSSQLEEVFDHGLTEEEFASFKQCFYRWGIPCTNELEILLFDAYENLKIKSVNEFIKSTCQIDIAEEIIHNFFPVYVSFMAPEMTPEDLFPMIEDGKLLGKDKSLKKGGIALLTKKEMVSRITSWEKCCEACLNDHNLPDALRSPIENSRTSLKLLYHFVTHEHSQKVVLDRAAIKILHKEQWEKKHTLEERLDNLNKYISFINHSYLLLTSYIRYKQNKSCSLDFLCQFIEKLQKGIDQSVQLTEEQLIDFKRETVAVLGIFKKEKEKEETRLYSKSEELHEAFAKKEKLSIVEWYTRQLILLTSLNIYRSFLCDNYLNLELLVFKPLLGDHITAKKVNCRMKNSIVCILTDSEPTNESEELACPHQINEQQQKLCKKMIITMRVLIAKKRLALREKTVEHIKKLYEIVCEFKDIYKDLSGYADFFELINPEEIWEGVSEIKNKLLDPIRNILISIDPELLRTHRAAWIKYFQDIAYIEMKEFILGSMFFKELETMIKNFRIFINDDHLIDERLIPCLEVEGIEGILDELIPPLKPVIKVSIELPSVPQKKNNGKRPKTSVMKTQSSEAVSSSSIPFVKFNSGDKIRKVLERLKADGLLIEEKKGQTTGSHLTRIRTSEKAIPVTLVTGGTSHTELGARAAKTLNDLYVEKQEQQG